MMYQYAVYTYDPNLEPIYKWIIDNELRYEVHLNRTRCWIAEGPLLTEFLLRWQDTCPRIIEQDNYAIY